MDNQASMYSEKKLAYFETVYRESKLSKPQDINITVTTNHIYGVAYICEQQGVIEDDPVYTRFSCSLEEITKVYINNNNKMNPIYIQCDDNSKNSVTRRRIILPSFPDNNAVIKVITEAKAEVEEKLEKQRENEKNQKLKELESRRKSADEEFESLTSDWENIKSEKEESKAEEPVAVQEAAPVPTPVPVPAPEPASAPEYAPTPVSSFSVSVEDILGLDDILGIKHEETVIPEKVPEVAETTPEVIEVASGVPDELVKKDSDEIEAVEISADVSEPEPVAEKFKDYIEAINISDEFARKLTPKAAPKRAVTHKEENVELKEEPKREINVLPDKNVENMTLDDFETAVKKLKAMFDNGMITEAEFSSEKKKLLKHLY